MNVISQSSNIQQRDPREPSLHSIQSQHFPTRVSSNQVEIQVRKIYCVDRAAPVLPISIEDTARSEAEIEQLVRVNQDTRLNNRQMVVYLSHYGRIIWLGDLNYCHNLSYEKTCDLISKSDWSRLLECDQVHWYYCLNISLHVFVMDIMDNLFVDMLDKINVERRESLEAIRKQFPFKDLKSYPCNMIFFIQYVVCLLVFGNAFGLIFSTCKKHTNAYTLPLSSSYAQILQMLYDPNPGVGEAAILCIETKRDPQVLIFCSSSWPSSENWWGLTVGVVECQFEYLKRQLAIVIRRHRNTEAGEGSLLSFNDFIGSGLEPLEACKALEVT
ncbi:aspartate--tRNA ligase 2, cytoplasmic-like protein [Tanacetum coccineum]